MSDVVVPLSWRPVSAAQRSRWFLYRFDAGVRGSHNNGFAVRLHARVERATVAAALQCLVDRHPQLRTAFREVDGEPEQAVLARADAVVYCTTIAADALAGLPARVQADCAVPFAADAPPLIRAHLYHCPGDETVLLLAFDHLVGDGWSYWQLLDELDAVLRDGDAAAVAAPASTYADYVDWQRGWLAGEQAQAQLEYWRGALADAAPVLAIPADPRELEATDARQGLVTLHVPAATVERLRALTRRYAGTMFTTLLGAYQLLLYRYTGQDDIVVGAPMPGRSRPEWDAVVGDFVNPIALRCRFQPGESVLQCLKKARGVALRGMANQDLPFGLLVERLQPPRIAGEHPLFQTLFTFQKARRGAGLLDLWAADDANAEIEWGGYRASTFPVHQSGGGDELPLALEVVELGGDIRCDFEFDPRRFGRAAIERLGAHYLNLLVAMCDGPEAAIERLPLLSADEQRRLQHDFNARTLDYADAPVHVLFARQAALRPDAIAAIAGERSLSYGELDRRANQLARRLVQLGVGRDDRVALCVERDLPMLVGLLGVLKAGAAYLPLDPALPADRLAFILDDGAPRVLLTQSSLAGDLPATALPRLLLDDDATFAGLDDADPQVAVAAADLAYVLYTSGSTGQPKGVMVEHGNVLNLVHTHIDNCGLHAGDRMLQFASYAFDISVEEIFPPLAVGATIVLRPEDMLAPDAGYLDLLARHAVTIADLPTSFWVQWVQTQSDDQAARLPALRLLVVGGEKFDRRHLAQWKASPLGRRTGWLHNYGPTEATVYTSALLLAADAPMPAGDVSIGRPNPNTRLHLLDGAGQPVPIGVAGEIHVGGRGVARGYLNRPGLSAERFVADPFDPRPGARLYRTGDLGRWLANGEIEFQGRNDFQVKIRGYRVEPGEIERRLAACAGVRDVAVVCREDTPGDRRLVAYLVAHDGADLVPRDLRAALAAELADYMVPAAYVRLPALPLTANDKLDRAALPPPDAAALVTRPFLAPEGATEHALAAIWRELLALDRVGRDDHFFESGGHSLLALQLAARIRAALAVAPTVRELFAQPTLRAQAAHLDALPPMQADAAEAPFARADRAQPLPLSFAQQRLWLVDQVDARAGAAYHMPAALRLCGRLDAVALQAALARIVDRHEVLRTRFVARDGQPWQVIDPPGAGFALPCDDLSALAPAAQEDCVAAEAQAEARRPFDLAQGALIRARLLRLDHDEHVLLLTQHHIVSDGWSVGLLLRELGALYAAFAAGGPDPLPPLEHQYADFAAWQRQWLDDERVRTQQAFWRDHLAGAPERLTLPTDRPRPDQPSHAGARIALELPPALVQDLQRVAAAHDASPYMLLLAAWSLLLARLAGQDDVVIGTPVANRTRREVEPLLGLFVNTLALRVRLHDAPTVAGLLARVRDAGLRALEHADLPFEQVIEAVQPARSLAHAPLFQVMLAYDNTPATAPFAAAGLDGTWQATSAGAAHLDLVLELAASAQGLQAGLAYATDLFDEAGAQALLRRFVRVLQAMVADPAQPVAAIDLLDADERAELVVARNRTDRDYPRDSRLDVEFARRAADHPGAIALECADERLTYGELDARANRLAHVLRAHGVDAEARVALCLPRGSDLVVALLAVLKAGGAYVPLDPAHPRERLAHLLADCAPVLVLADAAGVASLPDTGLPLLRLDLAGAALAAAPAAAPPAAAADASAQSLAYLMYTSGSTGLPKGAMVTHRNVLRLVLGNTFAPIGADDCVAHYSNPAFDASTWEIWAPLLNGARLRVVAADTVLDPDRFGAELAGAGVTALWMTVGLFNQLVDRLGAAWSGLRWLIVGGDAVDPRSVARLLAAPQRPRHVVNGYGPTECTTFSICGELVDVDPAQPVALGRPIANTRVYVLDAQRQPVPAGVAGEIWIGGDGVARGYWNRDELTAERFVADPFDPRPGARLYRSGDRGRWRADGGIDFLGRDDGQVKLRGHRIELAEIGNALAACAGVRDAVVIVRDDGGERRLVAYVVAADAAAPEPAALRAQLAAQLPEPMLPAAFVVLDALPLTANGKVDRRALPAPGAAAHAQRAWVAPQGALETAVAALWAELLAVERVGRDDHFFDLGGHSLLAVRLLATLRREHGVERSLRELFLRPRLADFCAGADAGAVADEAVFAVADRSQPLPLSFAQQRLWLVDQVDARAGAAYHLPAALDLRGRLDRGALQAALARIVDRHEALRTRFVERDGQAWQAIDPPGAGFPLPCADLSALAPAARGERVAAEARAEAQRPFDLAQGPLVRARLLHLAPDEHVLLLTQHHIVSDGWSIGLLLRELGALYAAFAAGEPDPLPPLERQYADFAAWQRQRLDAERTQAQQAFWRDHLAGAPELLALPTDRPRPDQPDHAGARLSLALPPALVRDVQRLAGAHGCSAYLALLAGWSVLMARLAGQDDVVIGTPVANRARREVEPLLGFFVNTLALRVRLHDAPTVAELLARVRDAGLRAFEHADLPFEQVVEAVQPARSLAHAPLFQVMFALDNTPGARTLALPSVQATARDAGHDPAHFDLSLSLAADGDGLRGDLVYATALFDAARMQRLLAQYVRVLQAMVADADTPIDRIDLLGADERRRLLHGLNHTARAWPRGRTIHALFEERARATPDAVALVEGERTVAYAELERRANRWAHRLLALGVRADDRIAIRAERSIDMVVAMLAVLKAGAAYLPIDTSYPPERIADMLADASPVAVLTTAALAAQLPPGAAPVLLLDGGADAGAAEHAPQVDGTGAQHLAYVIYTSGSTGRAKGVMVEHRNVVQLAVDNPFAPLAADDCIAHCANPAFDASTWEIWGALLVGARVCIVPQAVLLDPPAFAAELIRAGVSAAFLTVSLFNQYAEALRPALPRLQYLLFGGEKTDLRQIVRVFNECRPRHLVHCYGPTETTTFATTLDIPALAEGATVLPIGRPIGNARAYLLDGRGQPVPVGVAGEIHIGGDGVARGYLERAELTAERFLPDPFAPATADGAPARMYRTGDLGRWREDGTIEFLARNDAQVKIRGFRIELDEIVARLQQCAGVREALVAVREDSPGDKRLVAWLQVEPGAEPALPALRAQLAAVLPDYMVPAAFVPLAAFPLNANGKIDRRALPAPGAEHVVARPYEAPVGDNELALAGLWAELLGLARIGRHDHFFELGGHSLLAVQLAGRVRARLHVDLPLRELFEHPLLSALAERITALQFEQFMADDLAAMKDELASLSEAELRALLDAEGASIE